MQQVMQQVQDTLLPMVQTVNAYLSDYILVGLLIAVGNEFAPGNPKPMGERSAYVKALCAQPEMARAIASLKPKGLAGNKQLVADLLLGRHYTLLALLYRIKNRGK